MLIIENFIPTEDKVKIQNRAYFDEDEETWKLKPLANKKFVPFQFSLKTAISSSCFFKFKILHPISVS